MIETFTIKLMSTTPSQHEMIFQANQLSEEDELFYSELKRPMDDLLKQPSKHSIQAILAHAKQFSPSSTF